MASDTSPAQRPRPAFHEGERALHEAYGLAEKMAQVGQRAIRPAIKPDDVQFFPRCPFLVFGLRDDAGRPWATMLSGPPGGGSRPLFNARAASAMPAGNCASTPCPSKLP